MNNKGPREHPYCLNRHQATCTRTDRDLYRICPSKLSRRELENLYFTLLENNVDLKKNLNLQQEKIKTLSTKVQRLSYPRNVNGAGKDSPVTTAIVNEQRDSIIQLKRANERMAERIRVLNMKLCSVKQFVGKSKVNNLNNATSSSSNTKSNCTSPCAKLVTAGPSRVESNSMGTQTDYFAEKFSNSSCDIKSKPTVDELNEKINNLQEELQTSRQRIEKLEALVMRLQGENQTVRAENVASEHTLQQQDAQLEDLKEKLRSAEAKVNDMNMELTIEKKKLAELETELKLAENIGNIMSSSVAKTIEEIEQKTVGGEAKAPTDEAKLIRDEVNVASDEVRKTQDKVQFIRGEVSDSAEYYWGDAMARTEVDTEPDDKILTRGEKDVATNEVNKKYTKEVNKVMSDIQLSRSEENVARSEGNGVPDDVEYNRGNFLAGTQVDTVADDKRLNNDEVNVARNEVNKVPDEFKSGELINVTSNEVNYDWGDFMTGTQEDTVADDKRLNKYKVNVARNEVNKVPSDKSIKLTRGEANVAGQENVARNEDSTAPNEFKRSELINVTSNEECRISNDVNYNWGDFMTGTLEDTVADDKRLNKYKINVARNEVNKVPSDKSIKLTRGVENVAGEENVARNEDSSAPGEFKRSELINATSNEEYRISNDVNYNWGDFMTGTKEDTVADDKKLNNDEVNVARNEDSTARRNDVESNWGDFMASSNGNTVPDDTILTKEEVNVTRSEVEKAPDVKEMTRDEINMAMNEVKKLQDDKKFTSDEKNVPRNEMKNSIDEVKGDNPRYREQQDLNKNVETEKDQLNIKLNQELINKISELVSQLEMIKITAAGEPYTVMDKIVKEKPTELKPHQVKTKKPDAISAPVNKQKVTQKSYDVKAKETDNTSSQAKKEKPMQFKSYEARQKKADHNNSHPINMQNPTQYKPCDVKIKEPEGTSCSTSINNQTLTQKFYDDKTKEADFISSQINKKKTNQFESYTGKTEATDNISLRIDKDKPMKYESYDVKTEVNDMLSQKNKDKPAIYGSNYVGSKEDDDFESQMKKKLAEYQSIDVTAKEADNILTNISNANPPKYESYDFETKESDDILMKNNDTIECILEVKSANERNKFSIQEPVSTYEVKGMRDTEQKRINYPTIPLENFDSIHEQSIENLSLVSPMAQELKSKSIPKSPRSDDDSCYQIPGPIPSDVKDQKREVSRDPYLRKSIDDPSENITDTYRKRLNKMSYVETSKKVGSFSESPLKSIIDEKSAKSKNSHGVSLRKRSLEEKSEKIRKTFNEPPNRISFQDTFEDNTEKPSRDLTKQGFFDEKMMKISDTNDRERPVKKSKDPICTRPSISLSDKAAGMSLDNNSEETLPFDFQPRLSLSAKTASIIKDYARDVETKSRKVKQRFSKPCATVIQTPDPSRILLPTESILKSKEAATSSCIREPGVNSPSTSCRLNMDADGYAPPTAGSQENGGIEPATVAHMREVDEPIVICGASATICVCPPSEPGGAVSAFRTCTGNIRFHTTQSQDNIRQCACRAKALEHYNCGMGAEPSTQRNSGSSIDNKAPRTYSVADKQWRATSPENTEHEISSMTDWVSDKDGQRSPQDSIDARARFDSLSEERGTSTGPSDHYTTASEGEVPAGLTSLGEMYPGVGSNQSPQQNNKNETMEAALQSITEELARCRKLLLSQQKQEKAKSVEHALRRSRASRQLSTTYTPVCVFTLHIGTLVLSDDTVVWSRDKNLVLTWKFYSQSTAMTRVQPGRVAIFDFVTEYDVVLNDDMLNYMKNSQMPIVLCELGKEEKPFAKCWLPLQEALLHANRRADMSLALVPCHTEASDNRQSFGEEIGVLDIWCSLRLDKSLLPVINRAMHKPSNAPEWHMDLAAARESCIIQQAAEDETSRESSQSRQSRDFALGRLMPRKKTLSMTVEVPRHSYSEYPTGSASRNFYVPGQDIPCHASERYAEDVSLTHSQEQQHRQQPRYNFHSFSLPAQKNQLDYGNRGRGGYERWSGPECQSSGIIMNEVPASIRTDNDMREALEQKQLQDNTTRWPKMEDLDSSLRHSSFGSVRSLAARHQLAKLKYPQKHKPDYVATDSFQDIMNRDKQYLPNTMEGSDPNFLRSRSSKYIGVPGINKLAEASRKSVKYSTAIERESPKPSSAPGISTQQMIEITILWLALNEECEAMANPNIKRLYVAYSFLGRKGADLETPFSLPKPKHYADKCYFNFKKTFYLNEADLSLLGHMAMCRSGGDATTEPRDCIVFTLVSEPPEDPLGLSSCEDVGYAYLYLGDVLAYSGGSNGYTEVVGVRGVRDGVCGVLAVRVDNLAVLRLCLTLDKP